MTPERWHLIQSLFESAVDLGRSERSTCLTRASAGDTGLRAEVEALLRAGDRAGAGEFIVAAIAAAALDLVHDEGRLTARQP